MNWTIDRKVDIGKGDIAANSAHHIYPLAYPGDSNAHEWRVTVLKNGEPYDMTGETVTGYFYRYHDGETPFVAGSFDGNVASVLVPAEAYAYEGYVSAIMRVTQDGHPMTLDALTFDIGKNLTDSIIDPGEVINIDTVLEQIETMEDLIAQAGTVTGSFNVGLYNNLFFESGMWHDTSSAPTKTANVNKIRNVSPIPIDLYGSIKLPSPFKCYCLVYTADMTRLGYYAWDGGTRRTEITSDGIRDSYPTAGYYVINVTKTDAGAQDDISQYAAGLNTSVTVRLASNYVDGALGRYPVMIVNAASLNAATNNTKSMNDFPVGRVITIGTSGLGVLNAPTGFGSGVVVTFDGRGAQTTSNGTMQFAVGSNGAYTRWCVAGAWSDWKTYALNTDVAALSAVALQGYAQYNSRADWLVAVPTDKLGDIPVNRVIMIGASSIAPSDQPVSGFYGNVITLTARDSLKPGAMQIAWNGNDRNRMYARNYIYASGGNYWSAWSAVEFAPEEYHVGTGYEYTSLTTLLLDLKGNNRNKVIYIHGGEYDIFAEYLAEVTAGRITIPDDSISVSTYFEPYNAFVPNNTRIVGLGSVVLKMTPTVAQLEAISDDPNKTGFGAAETWSPLNIYGSVELENLTVQAHNCRYCMHNDDHNQYPGSTQHYKNCRFLYELSDRDAQDRRLGFNNSIGFGIQNGGTHIYDDCEFYMDTTGHHSAFYGHEGNAYKDGTILVRNCVIHSSNFSNNRVIKLQSLATSQGHVATRFENCYINGGFTLELYNSTSKQNFETTFVNCNRSPVTRTNASGGTIDDPYTVTWYNPLPAPTSADPLIDTDTYE